MLKWFRCYKKVKNIIAKGENTTYHYVFHLPDTGVTHTICLVQIKQQIFKAVMCECKTKIQKGQCNYYSSRDIKLDRNLQLYKCACGITNKYDFLADMFEN